MRPVGQLKRHGAELFGVAGVNPVYVVVYTQTVEAGRGEHFLHHRHSTRSQQHTQAHVPVAVTLEICVYGVAQRCVALGGDYASEVQAGELSAEDRVDLIERRGIEFHVAAPVEVVYRVGHYRCSMAWRM